MGFLPLEGVMLAKIPRETPVHDGRAWTIWAGASDMYRVVGSKVVGNKIDLGSDVSSTPWLTWEEAKKALKNLSEGKDIELRG